MAVDTDTQYLRIVTGDDADVLIELDAIQGMWTLEQYLRLTASTNRLLEYNSGSIEVLPMPTDRHQVISRFLFLALFTFLQRKQSPEDRVSTAMGTVLYAPLRLRVSKEEAAKERFREPDLIALLDEHDPRRQEQFWTGADLVVEVVSPDDPDRDTRVKRGEYAQASIPEYWIVDPQDETVLVLVLSGSSYREDGRFGRGQVAVSRVLQGFVADVSEIFDTK